MARGRTRTRDANTAPNGATVGYQAQLWQMADALHGGMDAAEYKHVALGQLFCSTQIPACLWFLARDRRASPSPRLRGEGRGERQAFRDRRSHVLFIDARKLDRTYRELTDEDIARIAGTYDARRSPVGAAPAAAYADITGFCKSPARDEIAEHGHVLTSGRCVGAEAQEDVEEKMQRAVARLREQGELRVKDAERFVAEVA